MERLTTKIVAPDGPLDAKVCFIGQAPGKEENIYGKPFIGAAGQLLNRCLKPTGVARSQVLVNNVFAQRPREIRQTLLAQVVEIASYDPLADIEVRRNATIVGSAETLIAIDQLFDQERYEEAWKLANIIEGELRAMAAQAGDRQMIEDADLFARYQITLAAALGYDPGVEQISDQPSLGEQPRRWGATPAPTHWLLPTIDVDS